MPSRLADRLYATREHLFVGRDEELALFRTALQAEELPFFVLHVFGPAGVGKTSLLRGFSRLCRDHETAAHYLDARDVEPTPEAFLAALRGILGLASDEDPLTALAARRTRQVLLVDSYDALAVLDDWLREQFLPELPDTALIVLAGRERTSAAWRTDPGWQALMEQIPLRNLDLDACRVFLGRRAVSEEQHEAVLAFTHGHPLATSLVADLLDQQPTLTFQPRQAPDVIKTLLGQFVQNVPGPAHRAALEACTLVRFTTEALLQDMLGMPDVHGLFEWLRGLSFIEAGFRGLFPHDLAREVLLADLRWRNPDWYADLHRRGRTFYTERLKQADGPSERTTLSDYTYLQRDHPLVRPFYKQLSSQWARSDSISPNILQVSDRPSLIEMVERHEGAEAARLASHWFEAQPEEVRVYRDEGGHPLGFMASVILDRATPEERTVDPGVRKAWAYLETHAPLRKGEHALMFRFWMGRDQYQGVSPVQSLIFLSHVRYYLNTPGLSFSFLPCRDPAYWGPVFAFAGMERLLEADFEVGPHTYAVFGHDWRAVPPIIWLDQLAERGLDMMPTVHPEPPQEPVLVLSKSSFNDAVKEALRVFARPDKLRGNPLLRSRIVVDVVGFEADEAARIVALRTLLEETAASLKANPRDLKWYRALRRTYLQPAPTQEKAAERLGLPFSTFRRHLKRGIEQVADILWQRELGNV